MCIVQFQKRQFLEIFNLEKPFIECVYFEFDAEKKRAKNLQICLKITWNLFVKEKDKLISKIKRNYPKTTAN